MSLRRVVQGLVHAGSLQHTIVLAHALGCDLSMWDALADALASTHRVIRYDQFGHGGSAAPATPTTPAGPCTLAQLADEAAGLIDELAPEGVVWIGLSMGGMVGQELALRHPGKVRALLIANATSRYPAEARAGWAARIAAIREGGLEAIVDTALQRWFHDAFRRERPEVLAHWRARVLRCRPEAYIACCEAIAAVDTTDRLPQIQAPTLVIAGCQDVGTPPEMARVIAQAIPGARLVELADAAHLSVLEQPEVFKQIVVEWLDSLPPRDAS